MNAMPVVIKNFILIFGVCGAPISAPAVTPEVIMVLSVLVCA